MRSLSWLSMVLAGLVVAAPARAAEATPGIISPFDARLIESLISPQALLGEVVTERDLDLLLAHVKAFLLAAAAGKELPRSDELDRRAEAIGKALKTRGTLAALVLLDALEAGARERLRELQRQRALPPAASSMPGSI
jgi:hypothetical protein